MAHTHLHQQRLPTEEPTMSNTELPISDLLSTLNALRAAEGKPVLKSWKASRADLQQRIKDMTPGTHRLAQEPIPDTAVIAQALEGKPVPQPKPKAGAFLQAVKDVLNGANPDTITNALTADVPVTKVPNPIFDKEAERQAAINAQVDKNLKARDEDKPAPAIKSIALPKRKQKTTPAETNAKARQIVKESNAKAKAPKTTTTTPNEFTAYLKSIGMDAKIARAKLRRSGMSAPYIVNDALKAALTGDKRKK